ncbi:low molecular weight phosphatase family protein [Mycolicibacterium cosmeticum]|uniref:arsenate reductase/protein-tyrosine-phosphatase family protein n=1 Tax=Mycolicibacterium cosmeticum TaxID=258533 RepID=UPI003204ECD4
MELGLHVLFVCTGNICRSPTAERLAAAAADAMNIPQFTAASAGTRAVVAHPMHPEAARVLERLGGDPSGFAARQLSPRIAGEADLLLTMTAAHRDAVLELAPRQLRKTFTLAEAAVLTTEYEPASVAELAALRPRLAAHEAADVPDPIGRDAAFFAATGARIFELMQPILTLCLRSS